MSANNTAETDTICLNADTTYTFSARHSNLNSLPRITSDIIIEGNNATLTRSGSTTFRFFEVEPNGSLTLNDLTLSNGNLPDDPGGAILSDGILTLDNVTFFGTTIETDGVVDICSLN